MLNNKGLPQCSILGNILFILYINDIDTAFNKIIINYNLTVRADDNALTISALNNKLLAINKICDWLITNKLKLKSSKKEFMCYNKLNKI